MDLYGEITKLEVAHESAPPAPTLTDLRATLDGLAAL